MRSRSWNSGLAGLALFALAGIAVAQQAVAPTQPSNPVQPEGDGDLLAEALTCRVPYERYASLMRNLKRDLPEDFSQAYRQYSDPPMDLYRLASPISAWGIQGDSILIASNRVMMAVDGSLEEVTRKLEHALEQSSQSPLSGALDDQHALVIFDATQPGLAGMVLLGCEYRIDGVSLLDNPEDAWRRPTTAPQPAPAASP
ncbi:MAG: hypothetical protein EOO80_15400 [Oxalobacteraceae bacterium]|nr:MAG: hypothetical protein EOO80_15400 [Oxalobacteraceae bacterium]